MIGLKGALKRATGGAAFLFALALTPGVLLGSTLSDPPESAQATANDTLTLASLQQRAVERDPRALQADLEGQRRDLRLDNVSTGLRPQFNLRSDAVYQSEVTAIPITQPGVAVGRPPQDRYEAALGMQWTVWDGGRSDAQRGLEESRYDIAQSALDATLFQVKLDVTASFFETLLLREAVDETDALVADLQARLADVRARVDAGAALPGDTALLHAEVLLAQQRRDALDADRQAALDVLSLLTGTVVPPGAVLATPALGPLTSPLRQLDAQAGGLPASLRAHPQFRLLDAQARALDRELDLQGAGRMPVLQAFGDFAYGSPGYEQFTTELHDYWRAGVRMQWTPWDWGQRDRDSELLRVRQKIVRSEEHALEQRLLRSLQRPLRAIDRLEAALATDETIIRLREQVERQARAQFAERAIPAAAYTDARTNLTEARINQARHRTQLARAQAEALMTLGLEVR